MPFPIAAIASSFVGCASWFGYDTIYGKRREFWKETGIRIRKAPAMKNDVKVTVIVPAYNEEDNIEACVGSVLDNCDDISNLEVIVSDDMSSDDTVNVAEQLKKRHPRGECVKIISAGNRPTNQVWLGKCWAVWQAAQHASGEYIVFLDADVKLKPNGLSKAISCAIEEDTDLLSGDVAFSCKCAAEKLIQPLIIMNLVLNNDHRICNDDEQEVASAAGHIMIFKSSSYFAMKGHSVKGVRDNVVEDVMIAYYTKCAAKGTVRYFDFTDVAEIQMYNTTSELIEGYSKNIFIAFDQSALSVVAVSFLNIIAFGTPIMSLYYAITLAMGSTPAYCLVPGCSFLYATYKQHKIRKQLEADGRISSSLWWSHPVGAIALVTIAFYSMFKGLTGIGWTWKGRSLRMPEEQDDEQENTNDEDKKSQ